MQLIEDGNDLLIYLSGARVPMPKSTREYLARCDAYECRAAAACPWRKRAGTDAAPPEERHVFPGGRNAGGLRIGVPAGTAPWAPA